MIRSANLLVIGLLIAAAWAPPGAWAQTFSDSFTKFGSSKSPIEFQMDSLEIDEKKQVAILRGNVTIQQEKSVLKTSVLRVFYNGNFSDGGMQKISRMVAKGKVVITSGLQAATGNAAVFDMASQVITLTGDVVLSQGPNVISGDKLIIDMRTGKARIESSKKRIRMMLSPQDLQKASKQTSKKKKPK